MKPKIAVVAGFPIHHLPESGVVGKGYAPLWLERTAKAFAAVEDFDIHWVTVSKLVSRATRIEALGQTFHVLPRGKMLPQILTGYRWDRHRIAKVLESLQPDLVHGWGSEDVYGLATADWRGRSLVSMQGLLGVYCDAAPQHWLMRVQARYERSIFARAQAFSVESPWGRRKLMEAGVSSPIDLVEYGVGMECFGVERNPSERPLCLFVGTLYKLKGVDTLLTAFRDERLKKVDLVVLGTGEMRLPDAECPPNICFLGHQPHEEVRGWMSRAWALVHPTLADTSPNCVKEARVIGLPVVTTPNGGQTQYVEHGKSGWIHEAGDVEGLIQGVLAVTVDRETSLAMGEYDRNCCRDELAPGKTASRFVEIYRRRLAGELHGR